MDKTHIYTEQEIEDDYTSIKHINVKDNNTLNTQNQIDEDSIRRHEIERGSDIDYERRMSFKRQQAQEEANISGRDQLFIKEGNAEILRLITRGGQLGSNENLYINVPQQGTSSRAQPQYVLVENSGKEILMRRFIEEQANGKQIIREHYQVIPNTSFLQTLPNEVIHEEKHQQKENLVESDMQHAVSNQSLGIQMELENSLKQQNALLRQILLEKEKLEEKYKENEQALETQSLPCHSITAAAQTQTDCEIAVQTEPWNELNGSKTSLNRRRTRSENDDSMSEDDYEYVRYSPPNSPNSGIYWIKKRRQRKKSSKKDHQDKTAGTRKVITVESVKRKIRTPIQEEHDGYDSRMKRITPMEHRETRASNLRRQKIANDRHRMLQEKLLHDFHHDSLDEGEIVPNIRTKSQKNIKYFIEDSDGSENEVILHKNYYSADSLENDYELEDQINDESKRRMTESVPPTPAIRHSRREESESKKRFKSFEVESMHQQQLILQQQKLAAAAAAAAVAAQQQQQPKRLSIERQKTFSKTQETPDSKAVPRYMEWYVKGKEGQPQKVPPVKAKRKNVTKSNEKVEPRPEPLPRNTPAKEAARLLREDLDMAKKVESRIQLPSEALNHPLLQHSENRFERDYQTNITQQPLKMPHYLYPNTPPAHGSDSQKVSVKYKPNASPIKENEISKTTTTIKIPIEQNGASNPNITTTTTTMTTIMNAELQHHRPPPAPSSQHEDDHDSGIAMNSLLHGKRNRIADKKSVFTIAYDDVQIKRIQMSESDDNPPMS